MTNQKDLINKNEESTLKDTLPKNITIDDVLEFIKKNGFLYESEVKRCIDESKLNNRNKMMNIVNKRRLMYERLSKL